MLRRAFAAPIAAGALAAVLAPSQAAAGPILSTTLSAGQAVERTCVDRVLRGGEGYAARTVTAPDTGVLTARLTGSAPGDWDLGLYDARSGRRLGGSASFGSREVATALVADGQEVVVQGCRIDGGGETAALGVDSTALERSAAAHKVSLVRVSTPTRARKDQLASLGLDMTEHGGRGFVGVLLHGPADAAELRKANFVYTTEIADLDAQSARDREADRAFAASVAASSLPSGRDTYRTLADYGADMKRLVDENPGLVKPITLPHLSGEGRPVEGIEITNDVNARDGKPVFLQLGLHHAREWPSGEHAIEWAFELVDGSKDPSSPNHERIQRLLETTRTIVVPVINPDGFDTSRTFGATSDPLTGRGAPNEGEDDETVNILTHPNEYRRKNCRLPDSDAYSCAGPALGLVSTGVDPNRNYGGLWGGPGASADPLNETYRGPGPFSEPETRNVQDLVSKRHVTTLITNHTFSNLVLRPPGLASAGDPVDAGVLQELGDAMAAENGYLSLYGHQLYDTSGTTEDWSYGATGGLGYTFEIGCVELNYETRECEVGHFHPPFAEMVKEYEGETPYSDREGHDGGGNREAYFIAAESTADPARHSVLEGSAPAGSVLRLRKSFLTETSPVIDEQGREGEVQTFEDNLNTLMEVPASGAFEWHVNPSTRPAVALDRGSTESGTPSDPVQFGGTPVTQTDGGVETPEPAAPCGDAESDDADCIHDHVFDVPDDPTKDNARAVVRIEWQTAATDWDMRVYRADAAGNPVGDPIGKSQQGPTAWEQTTIVPSPGRYVVRVNNFAAVEPYSGTVTFQPRPPFRPAEVESWTMTCESPDGTVLGTQQVTIGRGERQAVSPCGGEDGDGKPPKPDRPGKPDNPGKPPKS